MDPQPIVVATRNAHKLEEIRHLLDGLPVRLMTLDEAGVEGELVEDGFSFEENAAAKAIQASKACGHWALADDSGLEVKELGGAPGVHSARYAGAGATDGANNEKLIAMMKQEGLENPSARFRCVAALFVPDGEDIRTCLQKANLLPVELPERGGKPELGIDGRTLTLAGWIEGEMLHDPVGDGGFGYDPLFNLIGRDETMAQLAPEEKNRISHRARAFGNMRAMLAALLKARGVGA
ncbi:MAG: non-canonical purine NTP pyrophosphatase [Planctomycetota bacterium]|jgi:XTP/dITP diphosphohydrolase